MTSKLSGKYLSSTVIVVLISYMVFAAVFFYFTNEYAYADQREKMIGAFSVMENSIESSWATTEDFLATFSDDDQLDYVNMVSQMLKYGIFVTDPSGDVIFMTDNAVNAIKGAETGAALSLPADINQELQSGEMVEFFGDMKSFLKAPHFTMGYELNNDMGTYGSMFFISPENNVGALLSNLMQLFFFSSLAVLMLTVIMIYFITSKMVNPLKAMAVAAKDFGQGDFDTRVEVHGDDEVAELAIAFNNMAQSLAKNEVMRRNFIANVSHDLKTPMTVISGFVDGILDGTIPAEQAPNYLGLVRDEVKRLSRLVNTLLELAKLESGELEMRREPFDLCETVRQVLISFEKLIGQKNLSLSATMSDDCVMARGDRDAVHRVVYNLIDNSIKFTPTGGEISVDIFLREKQVNCSIKNSGEGVSTEDLPHLFDRFYKTDKSRGIDKKGSGLGLYISKTIIERLGGMIRVQSVSGESTTFTFTLPIVKNTKSEGAK